MSIYTSPWKLEWNKLIRYPGGREIDRFRGIAPPLDDNRPEAWVGSDTRVFNTTPDDPNLGCAFVLLPDGTRKYLFEAIQEAPESVLGSDHMKISGNNLGVLVKLLDAEKQLALQCHPTREKARQYYDSPFGKAESWYIIGLREDVEEPPYVFMGFKEGVTKEIFAKAFDEAAVNNDVSPMEACCHKIPVQIGDVFHIAPGLPHAIGTGCFLIEVQEPSDITIGWQQLFKMYPPRLLELHRKILLDCYEYDAGDLDYITDKYRIKPEIIAKTDEGEERQIIGAKQTTYFSFSQIDVTGTFPTRYTGFPRVLLILDGTGTMLWDGGETAVKKADEIFVPYGVKNLQFRSDVGTLKVVICNPPQE